MSQPTSGGMGAGTTKELVFGTKINKHFKMFWHKMKKILDQFALTVAVPEI